MTRVAILAPGFPDSPGGVTDHTARLVRHWSALGVPVHASGGPDIRPFEEVQRWSSRGVTALLIQYVPFLYGRQGLSMVPERTARAAKRAGLRVTTFVHEPWVPPTRLPWIVLSPLQKRQLRRLLDLSDEAVTAVPAWRELLGPQTRVLAVGSTLGIPPEPVPGASLPGPVVFSPMASGLRWDWIAAAADAISATPQLVILGASPEEALVQPALREWAAKRWDWRGRLPAAAVLESLTRARLVLAPFVDGMTGRRTSVLAALSAGARTISSNGPLFDPVFSDGPLVVASTRDAFVEAALRVWKQDDMPTRRAERRAWYERLFEARALDRRLLGIVSGSTIDPPDAGAESTGPILEPA